MNTGGKAMATFKHLTVAGQAVENHTSHRPARRARPTASAESVARVAVEQHNERTGALRSPVVL
jgi:hypothetical protein